MNDAFDLSGKTAVILGAGSDIGASIARQFAAAGANLMLGDIDTTRLEAAAQGADADHRVATRRTDVTQREEVAALVDGALRKFGRVDVVANLAGVIHDDLVIDTNESALDRILAVNLKGVFFGCQSAVSAMTGRGGGSIINMASSAAFSATPRLSAYSLSKAAVVSLTRVLAAESGPLGIRVNAIAPGFVEGGMTTRRALRADGSIDEERLESDRERARRRMPLRTTGRPDDIAHAALYLASEASRYLTGQVIHANGGAYMP
jgi:3-oxoacyl-[acyl-carrier protein] reductase